MTDNCTSIHRRLLLLLISCCISLISALVQPVYAADPPASSGTVFQAARGTLAGPAKILSDGDNQRVGELWQPDSSLTFSNIDGGTGGSTTVSICYAVGNNTTASTNMKVNEVLIPVTLPPTKGWGGSMADFGTVTVPVTLNAGATNTIALGGLGAFGKGGWVCGNISVQPVASAAMSTMTGNGVLKIIGDYWPYLLLLVIMGITMLIIKKQSEAH